MSTESRVNAFTVSTVKPEPEPQDVEVMSQEVDEWMGLMLRSDTLGPGYDQTYKKETKYSPGHFRRTFSRTGGEEQT